MESEEKQIKHNILDTICPFKQQFVCTQGGYDEECDAMCIYGDAADKLIYAGYRKQSEGENIAEVHPVDEFICSECGIDLEGWTRVVTDEHDGDKLFYEYEFKYCPNCGAKMKGE